MGEPQERGGPRKGRPEGPAGRPDAPVDSIPDDDSERALAEIRRFGRAARLVADDPKLDRKQKCFALLNMMTGARRSELAAFLEPAIWNAAAHLFDQGPRDARNVIDAIRRLLRAGKDRCPTCLRPLPDHDELDWWRELSHDHRRPA